MISGYKENLEWLTLLSILGIYGYYFSKILPAASPDITADQIVLFTWMVVLLVVVNVVGAIVLVSLEKFGEPDGDERDKLIALKGNSIAGWVLTAGVFVAMWCSWTSEGNFWVMHALLASLVASQVADSVTRIFHYRMGS